MTKAAKKETQQHDMSFGADVSRLLEIVAHALYSNRDVFLRELISNASDACDRLRYEAIAKPELLESAADFKIHIYKDTKTRTITIADNGIGMSKKELIDNLGTIAKSGSKALMEKVETAKSETDKLSLIGQFGVGFYATFMIANTVDVISHKAGSKETWHWTSDGKTGFSVRKATDEEKASLPDGRGTVITAHINDKSSEFLIDEKIKQVVKEYSDHIDFPIYLGSPDDKDLETINTASALWTRPKQDITEEQYTEFYRSSGHAMDVPLITAHWKAEGLIEYNALLFIPTLRPWDLYDPSRKHAVKLYVKRIFITDDCEGLVYPWLRFLRGVIDSQDLPLNISREMLQHNPVVTKIRNGIAKRVLSDLNKLSEDNPAQFSAFWGQFGAVVKEGLYDGVEHKDALLKVARFYSSEQDELTSLADYVSRMKEGQKEIYYISGEKMETLKNSPQLEGFKSRGIEVLYFTDTIDDFWLQAIPEFDKKPFKSITKGHVDLPDQDDAPDKNKKSEAKDEKHKDIRAFADKLQEILHEEVGKIYISSRLTDSPVCLVAGEDEVDLRMERVLKINQKYEPNSKRALEINPDHTLIKRLSEIATKSPQTLEDAAFLLLDQAYIIQGEPIENPARFAKTMSKFMEKGL